MITHIIYEIPKRKVGCSKDLEWRMQLYEKAEGERPFYRIREYLYDKTDQEAGDIEWSWADRLGYKRGSHYAVVVNAMKARGRSSRKKAKENLTPKQQFEIRQKGIRTYMEIISPERRSEIGHLAGTASWEVRKETMTREQWVELGKKGGKGRSRHYMEVTTPEQRIERARSMGSKRGRCPHCGIETNVGNLKRYHFDKCPHKLKNTTVRLIRRAV